LDGSLGNLKFDYVPSLIAIRNGKQHMRRPFPGNDGLLAGYVDRRPVFPVVGNQDSCRFPLCKPLGLGLKNLVFSALDLSADAIEAIDSVSQSDAAQAASERA
jgi:hypothetical protein